MDLSAITLRDRFGPSFLRQSLNLSHISSQWRQISISMPDLWPIWSGMRHDAFRALLERVGTRWMAIQIVQLRDSDNDPESVSPRELLDVIAEKFSRIKFLDVSSRGSSMMVRLLELGRRSALPVLAELSLSLDPDSMVSSNLILDWDTPALSFLSCEGVPISPKFSAGSKPRVWFQSRSQDLYPRMSFETFPLSLLEKFEMDLFLTDTKVYLEEPIDLGRVIILPRLEFLKICLVGETNGQAINCVPNFGSLRFPKLTTFRTRFFPDHPPESLKALGGALMSMLLLQEIHILNCVIPIEEFFQENLFPSLKLCAFSHTAVSPDTFSDDAMRRNPSFQFPCSLADIRFVHCQGINLRVSLQRILQALCDQFGEDYEFGRVSLWSCWNADVHTGITIINDGQFLDESRFGHLQKRVETFAVT